jgi:hypothetical protein
MYWLTKKQKVCVIDRDGLFYLFIYFFFGGRLVDFAYAVTAPMGIAIGLGIYYSVNPASFEFEIANMVCTVTIHLHSFVSKIKKYIKKIK